MPAASLRAEPPAIAAKQAQARQVLADVQALDTKLERSVEAYDRARWQLGQTEQRLRANARALAAARSQFRRAEAVLAQRAVAIYESGQPDPTLELLLDAGSLNELLDELDAVKQVAAADVAIVRAVEDTRARVAAERVRLRQAQRTQAELAAQRAAARTSIEGQIVKRQRLLSSIRGEIARLQAEERVRQAQLRREALARLAAERAAAARAAALARKQAQARAEAQRRSQREQRPPAPQPSKPAPAATNPAGTDAPTEVTPTDSTPPPTAPPAPPPTGPGTRAEAPGTPAGHPEVVAIALKYLGVPYQWGGASPTTGFDCSGLVMYVYAQIGVSLPHYAAGQYGYGVPVSRDQLQPGDLVFFNGLDHVGIYIGGGQFVHAPQTGDVVKISSLAESWYAGSYDGARRL